MTGYKKGQPIGRKRQSVGRARLHIRGAGYRRNTLYEGHAIGGGDYRRGILKKQVQSFRKGFSYMRKCLNVNPYRI